MLFVSHSTRANTFPRKGHVELAESVVPCDPSGPPQVKAETDQTQTVLPGAAPGQFHAALHGGSWW